MKSRLSQDNLSFIKTFVFNSNKLFTEHKVNDEHSAKLLDCQEMFAKIYPVAENAALDLNINLGTKIPLQEVPETVLDRSGAFFALTQKLVSVIEENPNFQNVPVHFGLSAADDFMDDITQTEALAASQDKASALKSSEYMKASIPLIKERALLAWNNHKNEVYSSLDSSDINTHLARAISDEVEYLHTPDMYDAMALDALYNSILSLAEHKRPLTPLQVENEIVSQLKMEANEKARYRQIISGTNDLSNLYKIVQDMQHRYLDTRNLCNNCDLAVEGLGVADKSRRVREILLHEASQAGVEAELPDYLTEQKEIALSPKWKAYEQDLSVLIDTEVVTGVQMLTAHWVGLTAQKVANLRQELNGLNDEKITPEQQGQFFDKMFNVSKEVIRVSNAAGKYLGVELNPLGATFRHLKEFASPSLIQDRNSYKFFDSLLGRFGTEYKKNASQIEDYKTDIDHLQFIDKLETYEPSLERRNIYFYSNFAYQALYDDAAKNAEKDKNGSLGLIKSKHQDLSERLIEFTQCLDLPKGTDAKRVGNDIDNAVAEYFLMPLYMRENPQEDAFEQALEDVGGYYELAPAQRESVASLMQYHLKESVAFHKNYIRQNDDAEIIRSAVEEKEYNHLFSQGYALSMLAMKPESEAEQENYRQYKEVKTKAYYNQQQDNSRVFLLKKNRLGRK